MIPLACVTQKQRFLNHAFVAIIQVAIAVGSLVGGTVVDQVGIPADFWFGRALALLGLAAVACFGATVKTSANAKLTGQVRAE